MPAIVTPESYRNDLINQFRLMGDLVDLEVPPFILPVWLVGQSFNIADPVYESIFTAFSSNPGANTVFLDTGALPAGTYDCQVSLTENGGVAGRLALQHRDAANTSNVSEQLISIGDGTVFTQRQGFSIALNERIRWFNIVNQTSVALCGVISLHRRA